MIVVPRRARELQAILSPGFCDRRIQVSQYLLLRHFSPSSCSVFSIHRDGARRRYIYRRLRHSTIGGVGVLSKPAFQDKLLKKTFLELNNPTHPLQVGQIFQHFLIPSVENDTEDFVKKGYFFLEIFVFKKWKILPFLS